MKTEFHFWELSNKSMFWLKTDFWQRLFDYKRRGKVSWRGIANKLEMNEGTLSNYVSQFTGVKKAQYIPLQTLIKISNDMKIVEVIDGGERTKGRWGGRNPYVYKLLKMVIL